MTGSPGQDCPHAPDVRRARPVDSGRRRVISPRTPADALPDGQTVLSRHALHLEPAPRLVRTAREFVREHASPLPPETLEPSRWCCC